MAPTKQNKRHKNIDGRSKTTCKDELDEFLDLKDDVFYKVTNTSAVSSTGWIVDTQLCKRRGTSGSFVLYFTYGMVFVNSNDEVVFDIFV